LITPPSQVGGPFRPEAAYCNVHRAVVISITFFVRGDWNGIQNYGDSALNYTFGSSALTDAAHDRLAPNSIPQDVVCLLFLA
jgi:hypothetical protein